MNELAVRYEACYNNHIDDFIELMQEFKRRIVSNFFLCLPRYENERANTWISSGAQYA